MTGLEAILAQIEQDAQCQREALFTAAKAESHQILEEAQQEADRQAKAILEEAQRKADEIRARAESTALLEKRDRILRCKQLLIRDAMEQACEDLENAPAEEYFSILLELVVRFRQAGCGVLYLNARDLARVPQGFAAALHAAAPTKGEITVSPTPRDIPNGFVLVYGLVEIDCTFQALFQEATDQLRDAVGAILFAP